MSREQTAASVSGLLQPMKDRLTAATPGPWESSEVLDMDSDGTYELAHVTAPDHDDPDKSVLGVALNVLRPDATFIAAAPTDQAKLIAAVEAVETLAADWTQRGEHDMAYSKMINDPDIAMALLTEGASMVENARLIREALTQSLGGDTA